MYDLVIAYRIYPWISKKPLFFDDDKLKLTELGIKSYLAGLWKLNAKTLFLLDWCSLEYDSMIEKLCWTRYQYEIYHYNKIGNFWTFAEQIRLLEQQNQSEYIYFAEDDYLYAPDSIMIWLAFLKQNPSDFITLYDHSDNYRLFFQAQYHPSIALYDNMHRRTNVSTCLTFMCSKATLKRYKETFLTYCKNNYDYGIRLSITKQNIIPHSKDHFFMNLRALRYNPYRFIFQNKSHVFSPIPSLATHLESTWVAPGVDRNKIKDLYN